MNLLLTHWSFSHIGVTGVCRRPYGVILHFRDDMSILNYAQSGFTTENALFIVTQIEPGDKRFCVGHLGFTLGICGK
jgi:hypothetical protein